MVPNVGTKGYHGKELPVPRPWSLRFPTWEPEVAIARGIAGSQKLEFMFSKLSNYHCKGFPKLETHGSKPEKAYVTSGRISWFQKVKTHGS